MVLNKFRDRKKIFYIDEMTADNMTEEMVFAYIYMFLKYVTELSLFTDFLDTCTMNPLYV